MANTKVVEKDDTLSLEVFLKTIGLGCKACVVSGLV